MATSNDIVEGCRKAHMGNWKSRQREKTRKGSQTPGKTKGENCIASGLDRLMATRNRSWKHPLYSAWCQRKRG